MLDAWLHDIVTALGRDRRVVRCWVTGSIGAGTADRLSDIDLKVEVRRSAFEDVLASRLDAAAVAGRPLAVAERAVDPDHDHLCLVLHDGPYGVGEVDWHWLPEGGFDPDPRRDRQMLERKRLGRPTPQAAQATPADAGTCLAGRAGWAWLMAWIAVRYAARRWPRAALVRAGLSIVHLNSFVDGLPLGQVKPGEADEDDPRRQLDDALLRPLDPLQLAGAVLRALPAITSADARLSASVPQYLALAEGTAHGRDDAGAARPRLAEGPR